MKKLILLAAIILTGSISLAQVESMYCPANNHIKKKQVIKPTTYYILKQADGSLLLSEKATNKFGYGAKVKINEDHTLLDSYSAPCGNDTKIHKTKGTWKLSTDNSGNRILKSSVAINFTGKIFYLTRKDGKIILNPINHKGFNATRLKQTPMKISPVKSKRI